MMDGFGNPRTALILGGRSEIAHAALTELGQAGLETAVLAVRAPGSAETWLAEHPLPGVDVHLEQWDANDAAAHGPLLDMAASKLGDIDLVICAVGSLGHGAGLGAEPSAVAELLADNMTGPATALIAAADHLQAQGHGVIVVLSSVAGLRARKSNFVYGSAKGGLDIFAQGLADALTPGPVRVHIVRPGFVKTKMTDGLPPAPFATTPDVVGRAIADAVTRPRNLIVHVPRLLGPMFLVLRNVPSVLWRRIAGDR